MSQSSPPGASPISEASRTVHGPAGVSTRISARQRPSGSRPLARRDPAEPPARLGEREHRRAVAAPGPTHGRAQPTGNATDRVSWLGLPPPAPSGPGVRLARAATPGAPRRPPPRPARRPGGAFLADRRHVGIGEHPERAGGHREHGGRVPAAAHTVWNRPRSGSITTRIDRRGRSAGSRRSRTREVPRLDRGRPPHRPAPRSRPPGARGPRDWDRRRGRGWARACPASGGATNTSDSTICPISAPTAPRGRLRGVGRLGEQGDLEGDTLARRSVDHALDPTWAPAAGPARRGEYTTGGRMPRWGTCYDRAPHARPRHIPPLVVADGDVAPRAAPSPAAWPGWSDGVAEVIAADGGLLRAWSLGLEPDRPRRGPGFSSSRRTSPRRWTVASAVAPGVAGQGRVGRRARRPGGGAARGDPHHRARRVRRPAPRPRARQRLAARPPRCPRGGRGPAPRRALAGLPHHRARYGRRRRCGRRSRGRSVPWCCSSRTAAT